MMSWGGVMAEPMGWGVVEEGWRKGPWTAEEDNLLIEYVNSHGEGRWNSVARLTGLKRNGKSCRLRWVNYLRPDLKRGQITPHEETIILELHARWGNRWSTIARSLPGRTDNEIKNYWRTHFKKKAKVTPVKPKAQLLKRQQFQQQEPVVEIDQMEMKKIVSLLDNDNKVPDMSQVRPELGTSYPNSALEQGLLYSMLSGFAPVPDAFNEDSFLWDGLWNLDDHVHGSLDMACPAKRGVLHNASTTFY